MQLDVAAARLVVPAENPFLAVTSFWYADTECVSNSGFACVADLDIDKLHLLTIHPRGRIGDSPALVPAWAAAVTDNVLRSDVEAAFPIDEVEVTPELSFMEAAASAEVGGSEVGFDPAAAGDTILTVGCSVLGPHGHAHQPRSEERGRHDTGITEPFHMFSLRFILRFHF